MEMDDEVEVVESEEGDFGEENKKRRSLVELDWTVRKRGAIVAAKNGEGFRIEGLVELVQLGERFSLRFSSLKVQLPEIDGYCLGLFLCEREAKKSMKEFSRIAGRQEFDHGIEIQVSRGNIVKGLYGGDALVGVDRFQQDVDKQVWPGMEAMEIKSVIFGKCDFWLPKTANDVLLGFANLQPVKEDLRKHDDDLRRKREERKRVAQKMQHASTWVKGRSLEEIRALVKPRFKYFDKDGSGAIDFEEFKGILENLGLFLGEARAMTLFQLCDLDRSGEMDMDELPLALRVNDMLSERTYMTPSDAFTMFDYDNSGELNEHEFYEALQVLCVTGLSREEASRLFEKHDTDGSGVIEYEEFKNVWLDLCDCKQELEDRGLLEAAERRAKQSKRKGKKRESLRQILREAVDAQEVEENQQLDIAYQKALQESKELRLKQDRRRQELNRKRRKEALAARQAKSRAERQARIQAQREQRDRERMRKQEEKFRAEMEKEIKERLQKERIENERQREWEKLQEKEARARRGDDRIDLSGKGMRELPAEYYRGKQAQEKLTHTICIDLSENKLKSIPDRGFLFWCGSLRKLDLSHNRLETIAQEVETLENLQILSMNRNCLLTLPPQIGKLEKLVTLNLGENNLECLPKELGLLKNLRSLMLYRNKLVTIQEQAFHGLENLKKLDLSLNKLVELPESVASLSNLTHLDLSWNKVRKLPRSIGELHSLEVLEMSSNEMRRLPNTLHGLRSLEILNLGRNHLVEIPESIQGLRSLLELNAPRNNILRLPECLGSMRSLQRLDISYNRIRTVPQSIGELKRLMALKLQGNKLETLPLEIGALPGMQDLDVSHNQLRGRLVETIGALRGLTKLNLAYNEIEGLPNSFGALLSLDYLNVSHNKLREIPASIGYLRSLQVFMLSGNQITSLPHTLHALRKCLRVLDLSSNLLQHLPSEIGELENLRELQLHHNRLQVLPPTLGKIIPSLQVFTVMQNPLSQLPRKWCDNWEDPSQRANLRLNGYSDSQVADWVAQTAQVFDECVRVYDTHAEEKHAKDMTLRKFVEIVREQLGEKWRERYGGHVERFYFQAQKLGVTPRFDALYGEEATPRMKLIEAHQSQRLARIMKAKKIEEEEHIRIENNYAVSLQELIHIDETMEARRKQQRRNKFIQEQREMSDVLRESYARQQAVENSVRTMRQTREFEERAKWLEIYNSARQKWLNQLDRPHVSLDDETYL